MGCNQGRLVEHWLCMFGGTLKQLMSTEVGLQCCWKTKKGEQG